MTPPSRPGSGRGSSGRPSRGSGDGRAGRDERTERSDRSEHAERSEGHPERPERPEGRPEGRTGGEPRPAGARGSGPRPGVPRPRVPNSRTLAQKRTSPISTFGGLAVVAVVLLAGLGYGYATGSQAKSTVDDKAIRQLPVSSATAVCQGQQGAGADTQTSISSFSPGGTSPGSKDSVDFTFVEGTPYKGFAKLPAAGVRGDTGLSATVFTKTVPDSVLPESVPLVAQAAGDHAPGFSVAEKIRSDTGTLRGLADTPCTAPSTDFWFAGVSLAQDRQSTLYLANPDPEPASVNLAFYGPDGPVDTNGAAQQITVAAHGFQQLVLGSFPTVTPTSPTTASVHVVATSGRVSALVEDSDEATKDSNSSGHGIDFIPAQPPSAPEQATQTIPGIPAPNGVKDKVKVELVLTAVGTQDASVDTLQWTGASSFQVAAPTTDPGPGFTKRTLPIKVPLGKTVVVDLSDIPSGEEAGAITLTNSGGALLSGIRVVAAAPKGTLSDTAYLAPGANLAGTESIVTDNHVGGQAKSILLLSDLGTKGTTVRVTTVPTGGQSSTESVSLQPNQTLIYPLKAAGDFTAVVDVPAGGDQVYAARQMWDDPAAGGVQTTLQVLLPARITAAVPPVAVDLSGAVKR